MKIPIPFKNDPFMRTSITFGLGLTCMIIVLQLMLNSLDSSNKRGAGIVALEEIITICFTLFGSAYLVRFIGRKPMFYTAICGASVGFWLAFYGLVAEIITNADWSLRAWFASLLTFGLTFVIRAVPLALIGAIAGRIVTRGRIPIEIEVPGKKDYQTAEQAGLSPPVARIITPLESLPGTADANRSLLEQLDKDPESLLPEKERRRRARAAAKKE